MVQLGPLSPKQSINMGTLTSASLKANNQKLIEEEKKKAAQKAIADKITRGITTTGSIPLVTKAPVKTAVQDVMTPATIKDMRQARPSSMVQIAGNVSPQSLSTTSPANAFDDLYKDFQKGMPASEVANLYPEYKGIDPKVFEDLKIDIAKGMPVSEINRLYPELSGQPTPQGGSIGQDVGGGLLTSIMKTGRVAAAPIQYVGEKLGQGIDYLAGTDYQKTSPFKIAGQGAVDQASLTNEQLRQSSADTTGARPDKFAFKAGEFAGDVATSTLASAAGASLLGGGAGVAGLAARSPVLGGIAKTIAPAVQGIKGTQAAAQAAALVSKYPKLAAIAKGAGLGALETQTFNLQSEGKAATAGETAIGGALGGSLVAAGQAIRGTNKWIQQLRLDNKTKNALKTTTPDELANYINVTKGAIDDIGMPTAYEIASNKTDDAVSILRKELDDVGGVIGSIRAEKSKAVSGIQGLISKVDEALSKYARGGVSKNMEFVKKGNIDILAPDEQSFINNYLSQLKSIKKNPNTQDLIDLNSYLNANINKIDKGSKPFKAIFAEVRGETNNMLDELLPKEYRQSMVRYKELTQVLEEIDRIYGQTGEKGSTMIRNMFGSNSAKTREIFTKIKKLTGVDLYKEGQLAKFVMEAMDEKRGLGLMLSEIPTTPLGIVGKIAKKGADIISDPIKGAKAMITPNTASKTSKILGKIRSTSSGIAGSKTKQ